MKTEYINIVMDAPPGAKDSCFVEVETDDGKSINAGEWIEQENGFWALRILMVKEDN